MACPIVQGREILCRDGAGGVAEIYLTEFDNVPQANITASSGVITAATCSSGKRFYTYILEKENAQFDSNIVSAPEGGTYIESTLTFDLRGMSTALKNNLLTLAYNRLHVIVKDNQATPVYHWMGATNGADMTGAAGSTGKAFADLNKYTLTIISKELVHHTVSAAIVQSLQVGS